jgi:hypothetical protein
MQAQLEASFVHTTQMFPSGESVGSASYLSENRSVAHNKAAAVSTDSLCNSACLLYLLIALRVNLLTSLDGAFAVREGFPHGPARGQDGGPLFYRNTDQPGQDAPGPAQEDLKGALFILHIDLTQKILQYLMS